MKEIATIQQGTSTIPTYHTRLKILWDEYASMLLPASYTCLVSKVTKEHEQTQKVMQFLMGLNENYSAVQSSILLMNPLLTINMAYSMLNQEEKQREITNTINNQHEVSAFFTHKAPNNQTQSTKQKKSMECEYCHLTNHIVNYCWKLHGYPKGQQRNKPKKGSNYKTSVPNHSESDVHDNQQQNSASVSKPSNIFTPTQY
ncbi:uncharacterized protein LOC116146695 [Pistacia vera]|uniref:uncharacterized protein LOC116146695 n=1 Tax=Pistacia vera TaxID=55513 RepID=UPI001262DF05|nr:uncharacterized protein LOC116146695 [Pistacia vera]